MAAEKSYARLGVFVVVTLVVVLATAIFFIQRLRSQAAISMVTYTRENISGLDITSPVRLLGVPVGHVTDLRVEPIQKTIEIDFEVFLDRLSTIGLDTKQIRETIGLGNAFPNLRASIVRNPVSGEAYLLLDRPQNPPPPMDLGFTPSKPYVSSMPSITATVEDRLPALLDRTEQLLGTFRDLATRLPDSLDRSDRFFKDAERIVQENLPALLSDSRKFFATTERIIQEGQLPALISDSQKFFATTPAQIEQMRSALDRTEGTLAKLSDDLGAAVKSADLPTVSQSAREAADNSRLAQEDLRRSLTAIRDSLVQLRELARQLQEQPESVIYGPRPAAEKTKR